jgi:glycosyltransferase involved in cell wall biosynthesis
VAISETVRRRIARCYGRDSRVIPPPVDTGFYAPAPDPAPRREVGPYLCVSALVPYKKLEHAVLACSSSNRELVVIGSGPERPRLERLAGPSVRFLGWQPDEVIRDHYRGCRALLFPGDEDFGIVPAEAMACGAPVIALGRGGVAETVDDRVGLLYDEPGAEGLLRAIEAFEADGGLRDGKAARRKAEAFAMEVYRDGMLRLIEELIRDRNAVPTAHLSAKTRARLGAAWRTDRSTG